VSPAPFLAHLKDVASSPLALVAYVVLVGAWTYVVSARQRLGHVRKLINSLPEADRAGIIAKEYNTTPRAGLSAAQWLRSRQHVLLFIGFLSTLFAVTLIAILAVQRPAQESASKPIQGAVTFVTDGVKSDKASNVDIPFTVWNGTDQRVVINSFAIKEYQEQTTCAYDATGPIERWGLDLSPARGSLVQFLVKPQEPLLFTAHIAVAVHTCTFKAFGLFFNYSTSDGALHTGHSDSIYFVQGGGGPLKVEYLKPGRFERLLDTKSPDSFTYQCVDPYPKRYYEDARLIYDNHIHDRPVGPLKLDQSR
jgi:hypothetical protein